MNQKNWTERLNRAFPATPDGVTQIVQDAIARANSEASLKRRASAMKKRRAVQAALIAAACLLLGACATAAVSAMVRVKQQAQDAMEQFDREAVIEAYLAWENRVQGALLTGETSVGGVTLTLDSLWLYRQNAPDYYLFLELSCETGRDDVRIDRETLRLTLDGAELPLCDAPNMGAPISDSIDAETGERRVEAMFLWKDEFRAGYNLTLSGTLHAWSADGADLGEIGSFSLPFQTTEEGIDAYSRKRAENWANSQAASGEGILAAAERLPAECMIPVSQRDGILSLTEFGAEGASVYYTVRREKAPNAADPRTVEIDGIRARADYVTALDNGDSYDSIYVCLIPRMPENLPETSLIRITGEGMEQGFVLWYTWAAQTAELPKTDGEREKMLAEAAKLRAAHAQDVRTFPLGETVRLGEVTVTLESVSISGDNRVLATVLVDSVHDDHTLMEYAPEVRLGGVLLEPEFEYFRYPYLEPGEARQVRIQWPMRMAAALSDLPDPIPFSMRWDVYDRNPDATPKLLGTAAFEILLDK